MKLRLLSPLLAAAIFAAAGSAAHADLTVVTDSTIKAPPELAKMAGNQAPGGSLSGKTVETKTYYKGDKVRTETPDSVVILDPAGKTYVLNSNAKTYYIKSAADDAQGLAAILSAMKFDAVATVTPSTNHKPVAGLDALEYDYTGKITISMTDPNFASFTPMMPTITLAGQRWTTDSLKDADTANKATAAMAKAAAPGMMGTAVQSMSKQLEAIKGFPLQDAMTITMTFPDGSPAAMMFGAGSGPIKIDIKKEVKSVSEDPLTDDLFAVPADYMKVDPPAPPAPTLPGAAGGAPAGGNL